MFSLVIGPTVPLIKTRNITGLLPPRIHTSYLCFILQVRIIIHFQTRFQTIVKLQVAFPGSQCVSPHLVTWWLFVVMFSWPSNARRGRLGAYINLYGRRKATETVPPTPRCWPASRPLAAAEPPASWGQREKRVTPLALAVLSIMDEGSTTVLVGAARSNGQPSLYVDINRSGRTTRCDFTSFASSVTLQKQQK